MEVRGRRLRFGIQLQAQRTTWGEFAAALQEVEDLGFDSAWTFDHLLPFVGPDDGACFETLTTLGAMAVLTRRVRVGVLVNGVLYRDPATLAKSAALVDQISGGRLVFSLGAAWAEREFRAYGLDYPGIAERYGRLDEALDIVRSLWREHRTTYEGRYYHVIDAPCEPKPVQRPHPPIMIGGAGAGSLRIAAKHATIWNVLGPPERCQERAAELERQCVASGRDFDEIELSLHMTLSLAPTHDEAVARAEAITAVFGQELAAIADNWLIGDPDELVRRLRSYTDLGFSDFVFGVGHPFDTTQLRLLAEEVLPRVGWSPAGAAAPAGT